MPPLRSQSGTRFAEGVLSGIAAITCILVALGFMDGRGVSGRPNPYLLEIALIGVLVGLAGIMPGPGGRARGFVPWAAAGVLFAFVVLGMLSIGPLLLPAAVASLLLGFLLDRRLKRSSGWHVLALLASCAIQAAVMWSLFTRAPS